MMTRRPKLFSPRSTQSGFTIIEGLLAIIIVSILLIGVAPMIVVSVATRVQSRRVELATQAARTYIDGVRTGKVALPLRTVALKETKQVTNPKTGLKELQFDPNRNVFATEAAPTALPVCTAAQGATYPFAVNPKTLAGQLVYPYCNNQNIPQNGSLYCVDLDQDGGCRPNSSKDLIVQAFRSATLPVLTDDGSKGYLLGVRVYRADAFDGGGTLTTTQLRGGKKVGTAGTGLGVNGAERYAPLVEMTTEVRGSSTTFQGLCDRLGGCK
ncbi:MAG TPA: prepilin-type N-terminal cleavage/methylation domain-containing protein [Coleofasciculaceae cyanobacterium]|jgi:type II secretory pathway pseudopilin PulG